MARQATISVTTLSQKLRNIANTMPISSPDSYAILMTAANRLEEQEERIAIMEEGSGKEYSDDDLSFTGGDEHEKL